tara:strand:+ start:2516 stop:3073 length:558 start_codon:yes stop_codon:yes gene_type:complete
VRLPACWPFLIAAASVVTLAHVADRKLSPYHFVAVTPGRLYRSGQLSERELEEVVSRYRIKTVVSLQSLDDECQPWRRGELETCRRLGVTHVDISMQWEEPPSAEQLGRWRALTSDPARGPILVHCQHGVVRTGMMVAVYELDRGRPRAEVLESLPTFGHRLTQRRHPLMWRFLREYSPPQAAVK